jgi:hypothetical protein
MSTVAPDAIHTRSPLVGTFPVDQFSAFCHELSPASPVQVSEQLDELATTAVASDVLEAEPAELVAVTSTLSVSPTSPSLIV